MKEPFHTVLLIDDEDLSVYITEKHIRDHQFGKKIFTFMSIEGAFAFLEKAVENDGLIQAPVAIFLDISMGNLDGWDFLNAYRTLPESYKEKCRIFILSSSIDETDFLKASTYPEVCRFISKPINREILEDIMLVKQKVL